MLVMVITTIVIFFVNDAVEPRTGPRVKPGQEIHHFRRVVFTLVNN